MSAAPAAVQRPLGGETSTRAGTLATVEGSAPAGSCPLAGVQLNSRLTALREHGVVLAHVPYTLRYSLIRGCTHILQSTHYLSRKGDCTLALQFTVRLRLIVKEPGSLSWFLPQRPLSRRGTRLGVAAAAMSVRLTGRCDLLVD